MQRSAAAIAVALLALWSAPAAAAKKAVLEDPGGDDVERQGRYSGGPFGLGIFLGEPTGLTAKLFLSHYTALQLHVGYGYEAYGRDRLVIVTDYLFHFVDAIPPARRVGRFAPYAGIGGRLSLRENNENGNALLAVRVPLGMSFMFSGAPIEIFVEIALGIGLVPETRALLDGGLGARFYF